MPSTSTDDAAWFSSEPITNVTSVIFKWQQRDSNPQPLSS